MTHHLGSTISALLDGRLGPAEAARAWAHLDACPRCAQELADARVARGALAEAAATPPPPATAELMARLLALQAGAPSPTGASDPFTCLSPQDRVARTFASGGAGALRGEVRPRRARGRLLAVPALGLIAVAIVLVALGSRPEVQPTAHPAAVLDLLGDAAAASTLVDRRDVGTPDLATLRSAGWAIPATLPDGWQVTATRWVAGSRTVLEMDLSGPDGNAVVTEQQGHLSATAVEATSSLAVGDRTVLEVSDSPWTVVWQAGSTVVQVVAAQEDVRVDDLVAAFPAGPYDDGVPARLGRGWSTVTTVFAGG
jgi:hypothetical protein